MNAKIAFYDSKPYDTTHFDAANREFDFTIDYFREHLTPGTAVLSRGHEAVCAFVNDHITGEVIDKLVEHGVRLIALRSAGYNNVDMKAAYRKMHVVRVPHYSPYAVAEHAAALMLSLNRKTHRAFYRTKDNNFSINGLMGFDMNGKTAGIIGTGKIGQVMTRILSGFGMRLLAYDSFPNTEYAEKYGLEYTDLDKLYSESDIITLHCPLNKDTHHIINRNSIQKMKPGVMIINTGRGKLIETAALIEGLKNRQVGAAGLDVYEEESEYFFEDFSNEIISDDALTRLLSFPNVLITSHQGFFTAEAMNKIASVTLNNIREYLENGKLDNEICYRCEIRPCLREKEGKCF